ncbi:molecular chaperone HtpG [Fusobacterium sp. PH5-44]|uniref:molecular chaperone HtpG n=1 Tax=unclassified Fusobacterium TaxID=2648384 RepID=UPI003D214399
MRKDSKAFQAETKELLNLMINSIYTNKDIFLRELISNGSDAIDKLKFKSLTDSSLVGEDKDYKIIVDIDKENRKIIITDNGIGMTYEDVEQNIGTIAKSGSKAFKEALENAKNNDIDIIGQFGVGFYSGFMVAEKISFTTKSPYSEKGVQWESTGDGNYQMEEIDLDKRGTSIVLHIKEDEDYNTYLEEWKVKDLIKKYSDYIRYPVYVKDEIINSTKPIWKKDKKDIAEDEYNEFYKGAFQDWENPFMHFHLKVQGNIEYTALLYIPKKTPMDFYTKDFKRGLQLYTKNVFIMDKCDELIPDYLGFLKGLIDCDTLSLNISREILQQNKELSAISKSLEKKILTEFDKLLKDDREKYLEFWSEFGNNIKIGLQEMFGMNKEKLQDLVLFRTSRDDQYSTLKEYVDRMGERNEILYAAGDELATIKMLPKVEALKEKGIEILYLTDRIDEFALKAMRDYNGKQFKSINDSDFKMDESKEKEEEIKKLSEDNKSLLDKIKDALGNKVAEVKLSSDLGKGASSLLAKGEISLEMEKVLSAMPGNQNVKAEKILALNPEHPLFEKLKNSEGTETFNNLVDILYSQGLMAEGFQLENPMEFINKLNALLSE